MFVIQKIKISDMCSVGECSKEHLFQISALAKAKKAEKSWRAFSSYLINQLGGVQQTMFVIQKIKISDMCSVGECFKEHLFQISALAKAKKAEKSWRAFSSYLINRRGGVQQSMFVIQKIKISDMCSVGECSKEHLFQISALAKAKKAEKSWRAFSSYLINRLQWSTTDNVCNIENQNFGHVQCWGMFQGTSVPNIRLWQRPRRLRNLGEHFQVT